MIFMMDCCSFTLCASLLLMICPEYIQLYMSSLIDEMRSTQILVTSVTIGGDEKPFLT